MVTPSISKLGHVGLHIQNVEKEKAFYRDTLDLKVTDEDPEMGMVFMSARPEAEHHELLLCGGRNVGPDARVVQQVSFRCETLEDVIGYYRRFKEQGVRFDVVLSHGNAVGIYFYDPEGNRCEIYCPTGRKARQPFGIKVDLEQSPAELMAEIRSQVRLYDETGIMRKEDLAAQNIDVRAEK
jgi:catechol-2,3-dioxygenase